MKKNRFTRLNDILRKAVDLPEEEREAFLDEACRGDPELRQEIESLLRHDVDRMEILQTGGVIPLESEEFSEPADMIGRTLSHFRIEEKIAVGGMGVLYKAVDTRLCRQVAIKVLKPNILTHPGNRERFVREARAASALNHSNIVTVYDIGTDSGVDFIVMEYVEGCTLDEVIPPEGLPLETVSSYALAVAEALRVAHEKGIVHRDLKPSNIMITEEGSVKILDFGIAKRLDAGEGTGVVPETKITQAGGVVGTIGYMSPEQVEGKEVDPRSDIFSFGVVLYELITGQPPFCRDNIITTVNTILHKDPEPLAKYRADAPDTLQWIVDKTLAKDRNARYRTTGDLVEDLHRFQRGQKLLHTSSEDAAEKHPKVKSLAILYLRNLGLEEDEYLSYGITEDLIVDLTRIGSLRVAPMRSILKHKDSDADLEEIAGKLDVMMVLDGSIQKTKCSVRVSVQLIDVETRKNLWANRWEEPLDNLPQVKQALAQGISCALEVTTTEVRVAQVGVPEAQDPQAYEYYLRGKYTFEHKRDATDVDVALGLYRQALSIEPTLLAARVGVGLILIFKAEYDQAEHELASALADARKRDLRADEANILRLYARLRRFQSQWDEALKYGEKALQIKIEVGDLAGEAEALGSLINTLRMRSKFAEALELFERVLEINHQLDDKEKSARAIRSMGSMYSCMGEYDRALVLYEEALGIARKRNNTSLEANCISDIGIIYNDIGDLDKALRCYEQALLIFTRLGEQSGRELCFNNIATIHMARGDYRKSLKLFEKSLAIDMELGNRASSIISQVNMALILTVLGEYVHAIHVASDALIIAKDLDYPLVIAHSNQVLGGAHFYKGEYESAKVHYLTALEVAEQAGHRRIIASCYASLGEFYYFTRDLDQCRKNFNKAFSVAKEICEKETLLQAPAYLAALMVWEGQFEEGVKQLREIGEEAKKHGDPLFILITQRLLGHSLLAHGRNESDRESGRAILQEALSLAREKEIAPEIKWIGGILKQPS